MFIGSIRRECTDHLIAFNAEHLRRIPAKYAIYYNEVRPHFSSGRTHPAHAQSSGSEGLLRIRSLAAYISVRSNVDFESDR
jgi:Integrase core domain